MALMLFDDGDGNEDVLSKIEINDEFARRYEHNKKREDLHRFEELKKKGLVDFSSSETESEEESSEEELLQSSKNDLEFFDALIKVRNHDPVLKNKGAKLFESGSESEAEGEDEEEENVGKKKKKKPMYLKDITAKHLIEEGPEFEEERQEKKTSYSEEQEQLRRAFLDAVEVALDGDDDGELLKVKKDSRDNMDVNDDNVGGIGKKLDEYFGDDDKLNENEIFLKEYFRKKMWLDMDSGERKGLDEEDLKVSEDEEEIERQEDYEREFNFRFEENAGDRVLGHSRLVEGSVRKKNNARKLQRQSKEERMAQAEFERKEELKHLKNLKKKEMNEKLRRIRETAGIGDNVVCFLDEGDLEEEFDPEEYDRKMKEAFDHKYYEANDADLEFESDSSELDNKPDFEKEDELLGLPKGWDDVYASSGDGFSAARERIMKHRVDKDEQEKKKEEMVSEEGKQQKNKWKMSALEEEVLNNELEEYYKLDYEDTIGELKTRFKYRSVNAKRYGLSTKEVLLMDDKELNQYVSLKQLAPYKKTDWMVPRNKKYNQKLRNKSLLEGETSSGPNTGRRNIRDDDKRSTQLLSAIQSEIPQLEVPDRDQNSLSRKSRRKRRQAELKLSHSRLMAYGKIPTKAKSKKKHQKLPIVQSKAF